MIKKIFLSFHFDPEAKKLADKISSLIRGFDIKTIVGDNLGGQQLTDGVKDLIDSCDAMIFILSKRNADQSNDWVIHEVSHGLTRKIPMIGLLEDGLTWPSILNGKEYIPYSHIDSADMWIKLCNTINLWKSQKGKIIKGILLPEDMASTIRDQLDQVTAEYQMMDHIHWESTSWIPCKIIDTVGGVSALLEGVQDNTTIKIRMRTNQNVWKSKPISQDLQIKLQ